MRRTNTDYKFNDDLTTTGQYYSSTQSLRVNDNLNSPANSEFDCCFHHLCHLGDRDDEDDAICGGGRFKSIFGGHALFESGIGSSISSIDGAHCADDTVTMATAADELEAHHDALPPVTEEDDADAPAGADNRLLDALPWRRDCVGPCCHGDAAGLGLDDAPLFAAGNDHIERPWAECARAGALNPAVLSAVCHDSSADALLESALHRRHVSRASLASDRAVMFKVFQKRHSVSSDWSGFTYKIKALMAIDYEDGDHGPAPRPGASADPTQ